MKTITDTSALYNYLSSIHKDINKFTVTEDFIQHRDKMKNKFRANGRDEETRLMAADCLGIEYLLLQKNLVEPPQTIFHDFIYDGARVDVKLITTRYFNIPDDKVVYYMENIRSGQLTHFAFYKYKENPGRPLKAGDKVEYVLKKVVPAEQVMQDLVPSQYKGYYYTI